MKYKAAFKAWWGPLTLRGDPQHQHDLTGQAFDAGYEAGRKEALQVLVEDIQSGNYRPSGEPLCRSSNQNPQRSGE